MDATAIAHESALLLATLVQESGRFRYRFHVGASQDLSGYNVLRHAGATWALLDVYRDTGDTALLEAGMRATRYLLDSHLRFYRDYRNVCICEDNKIKLGGNALATLALLSLYERAGDRFLLTMAEQLAGFMLAERDHAGDFIHKRYFQSGKQSTFHSAYYTGEALFALASLSGCSGQRRWFDAARDIECRLAAQAYGVSEQSHWMLYFLEVMVRHEALSMYVDHAAKIVRHILNYPAYLSWQRSTPIACRTEGLLAFVRLLEHGDGAEDGLRRGALRQVTENLERQLTFRRQDGSFVRGGNDRRAEEIRIDYLQHNISSFLHYGRLAEKA